MGAIRSVPLLVAAAVAVSGCAVGVTDRPTDITGAGATFKGTVFSNLEGTTSYWVKYGTATAYESTTPEQSVEINDDDGRPVSVTLRGLKPNTTYHARLCAKDSQEEAGPGCSADQTFRTLNEDSLTGTYSQRICTGPIPLSCATIDTAFDAYTGPSGQTPHGGSTVTVSQDDGSSESYPWDATCLNVQGSRATIGVKVRDPAGWIGPSDYARIWITDNGAGSDLQHYELRDTPIPSCPIDPPEPLEPQTGTGDYFVRDAQP